MSEKTKTIDLTPTWEGILPGILHAYGQTYIGGDGDGAVCQEVLERLDTRNSLYDELKRMAKAADLLNEALAWYAIQDKSTLKAPLPEWVTQAADMNKDSGIKCGKCKKSLEETGEEFVQCHDETGKRPHCGTTWCLPCYEGAGEGAWHYEDQDALPGADDILTHTDLCPDCKPKEEKQ